MRIYHIKIWGPAETPEEVQELRKKQANDEAMVFARSVDIANQLCYVVSMRDRPFQLNYQDIGTFATVVPTVLEDSEEVVYPFDEEIVQHLRSQPVLVPNLTDVQEQDGTLFGVRFRSESTGAEGTFWVYAEDSTTANLAAGEYGEATGLFNLDDEAVLMEFRPFEQECVFWNPEFEQYQFSTRNPKNPRA